LREKALVEIFDESDRMLTGPELSDRISSFEKQYPGTEKPYRNTRITWTLTTPLEISSTKFPDLTWQLTDLGKKAVDVVISAVASELAPKVGPGTKTR
jgi:hypothetical protein